MWMILNSIDHLHKYHAACTIHNYTLNPMLLNPSQSYCTAL